MPFNIEPIYHSDTQQAWKRSFMDFVDREAFTHAITLSWNCRATIDRARQDLRHFHRRVDRKLLGSRCERYPVEKRSRAFFVFEGVRTGNVHVHSVWRCPPGKLLPFCQLFPSQRGGLWNSVVPSGSYAAAFTNVAGCNEEIVGYLLKGQHKCSESAEMLWSDEFLPQR
jgi:hypothetical protein